MEREVNDGYAQWKEQLAKRGETPFDALKRAREITSDKEYCDTLEALILQRAGSPASPGQAQTRCSVDK